MGNVAERNVMELMPHLEVEGKKPLSGHLKVSGAKNSALALMAASLLTEEEVVLRNIPDLSDIDVMESILLKLGVKIIRDNKTLSLDPRQINEITLPAELVHRLRASFFCIGPLLARLGKAKIPLPGGCQIGKRPIEEHIRGLEALGACVKNEDGFISASIVGNQKRLKGAHIELNCPSVGATETLIMAACLAQGKTMIMNAAQEPEIQDLIKMLNSMGAKISRPSPSSIIIDGIVNLKGCNHIVIPDRIEAGTFLIAAAITRSELIVGPVVKEHLESVIQKLKDCGCEFEELQNNALKIYPKKINGVNIETNPFPGFPTDLQAPFMALMATANGKSQITENIFENRMQHVKELQKMGAKISIIDKTAYIQGVSNLVGSLLKGTDLRSAAAITLASLYASGLSRIEGLNHLDRGYESFELKLEKVGAKINRKLSPKKSNNYFFSELGSQNKKINQRKVA